MSRIAGTTVNGNNFPIHIPGFRKCEMVAIIGHSATKVSVAHGIVCGGNQCRNRLLSQRQPLSFLRLPMPMPANCINQLRTENEDHLLPRIKPVQLEQHPPVQRLIHALRAPQLPPISSAYPRSASALLRTDLQALTSTIAILPVDGFEIIRSTINTTADIASILS